MWKIFRRAAIMLLIVMSLLTAAIVGAAVQIFEGTGQYIMSDDLNHDFGKKRAQQRAERDAQKKAGVALKSFSRSINSELADDAVSAVVNNIIQISDVKIVPVPFETEGEVGLMYRATLKATIDTDGIYDWIKRDDKEKVTIIQQNTDLQDAIQKNDALAESLQEQYRKATTQAERDRIIKQLNDADRDFLANQKLEEGGKFYYAKDYYEAIKLCREALQIKPNWDWAHYNRGLAYQELNKYERAIEDYNKAIALNPNYENAYNNRGNAYAMLGQYERAIQDLDKAIQLNPNDDYPYNNRGIIYAMLGQYGRAIQDFDKAIGLNPNNAEMYYNRGLTYKKLSQYKRAIQDYGKAIELNPNHSSAYNNRGVAYYCLKKYQNAIDDATKAIQINPNQVTAYQLRGLCYQELGEEAKAQADFAKAKELGYNG